jgi:hypothetical protein
MIVHRGKAVKPFYKLYHLFVALILLAISASLFAMPPSFGQKELLCNSLLMTANSGGLNYYLKQPDMIYGDRFFFKTHVKDSVFEIIRSGSGWHSAYLRKVKGSDASSPNEYSDELSDEVLEDKESIAIYRIEGSDVVVTNMHSTEINAEAFLLQSGELNKLCNIKVIVADFDRKENSSKCRKLQGRLMGAREFRAKGIEKKSINGGATCQSSVLYANGEPLLPGENCGVRESLIESGVPYIYRVFKDGHIDIVLYKDKTLVCRLIPNIRFVRGLN